MERESIIILLLKAGLPKPEDEKPKMGNKFFLLPQTNTPVTGDPGVSGYSGITRRLPCGITTLWNLLFLLCECMGNGQRLYPEGLSTEVAWKAAL